MTLPSASVIQISAGALDSRQTQGRRFDTRDEAGLMAATLGVLQDLGYSVNETSAGTGLISASVLIGRVADRAEYAASAQGSSVQVESSFPSSAFLEYSFCASQAMVDAGMGSGR